MNTSSYQSNSYDGFATPSIGLSGGITRRGILKFTLPETPILTTATLSIMSQSNIGSQTYYVWRLLRPVTNGATWLQYASGYYWATYGGMGTGDIDPTALGSVTTAGTTNTFFDIPLNTAEVKKLTDGTYTNYGFLVSSTESTVVLTYYNYNNATVGYRPKLYLEYYQSMGYPKIVMY